MTNPPGRDHGVRDAEQLGKDDNSGETTIWVVGPDQSLGRTIAAHAANDGYAVVQQASGIGFAERYEGQPGCLMLVARSLPDESTDDVVRALGRRDWTLPVIVVADQLAPAHIVQSMRSGAYSVMGSDASSEEFSTTLRGAVAEDAARREASATRLAIRRRVDALRPGELDVLRCIVAGDANKVMARKLEVSVRTIEERRRRVFDKMGVGCVAHLVALVWHGKDDRVPVELPPLAIDSHASEPRSGDNLRIPQSEDRTSAKSRRSSA